jgi:hypothetical protein
MPFLAGIPNTGRINAINQRRQDPLQQYREIPADSRDRTINTAQQTQHLPAGMPQVYREGVTNENTIKIRRTHNVAVLAVTGW